MKSFVQGHCFDLERMGQLSWHGKTTIGRTQRLFHWQAKVSSKVSKRVESSESVSNSSSVIQPQVSSQVRNVDGNLLFKVLNVRPANLGILFLLFRSKDTFDQGVVELSFALLATFVFKTSIR